VRRKHPRCVSRSIACEIVLPQDQAWLRANPSKIATATEELLRAYSAVTAFRTCVKPVEIHGVQIMPGDKVAMCTTLANRDPEAFERPNDIMLERNPATSVCDRPASLCWRATRSSRAHDCPGRVSGGPA